MLQALNYQHQQSTVAEAPHVTVALSKERINVVFHSLSPHFSIIFLEL